MEMFTSTTSLPRVVPLDPTKHVNFVPGMVLGADDFAQEFAYAAARDQWLARDVVGHGTLWGLEVTVDGAQVRVAPGAALTPCGRLVCVAPAQCADLDAWLQVPEHEAEVRGRLSSPPGGPLPLWLVACYRECLTDKVPIPGEPCRSEDDLMAPSRVADDFKLELRFAPPADPDDEALRAFAGWLRQVEVVEVGGSSLEELVAQLRLLEPPPVSSPPDGPPPDEPPLVPLPPPGTLTIPRNRYADYVRAALRVWATDLRPRLRHPRAGAGEAGGCGYGCGGDCGCYDAGAGHDEPCEDAVLLARLDVPLAFAPGAPVEVADAGPIVDDSQRPYVLHMRLLQELGLGMAPASPAAVGPAWPRVIAAGRFDAEGSPEWRDGMTVKLHTEGDLSRTYAVLTDTALLDDHRYGVRGTIVVDSPEKDPAATVEQLLKPPEPGLFFRVASSGPVVNRPGFVLEVVDYTRPS